MNKKTTRQRFSFKYYAPEAKSVFLAGSFNGWNVLANPMKMGKDGNWATAVNLFPGTYEYQFIADGEWKNDPACEMSYSNIYGGYNSLLIIE